MGDGRQFLPLILQRAFCSPSCSPTRSGGAVSVVVSKGLVLTEELSGRAFDSSTSLREVLDSEIY